MTTSFISGYVLGGKGATALGSGAVATSESASPVSIEDQTERVDRIVLLLEALWSLLEDGGMARIELIERIAQIEGAGGKVLRTVRECPSCDAANPIDMAHCQYCGSEMGEADPFGAV